MTFTNAQYATQLTTQKGRQYIFDDMVCMVGFKKANPNEKFSQFYVADFCHSSDFIDMDQAILLQSDSLHSPMGGNIIGFAVQDSAQHYLFALGAQEVSWADLIR
jgi:copper chaperone NosL